MAYDAPDYKDLMRQYHDAMRMINTLRKERDACAATKWNYDLDAARDEYGDQYQLVVYGGSAYFAHPGTSTEPNKWWLPSGKWVKPIAWAHVNMPKEVEDE